MLPRRVFISYRREETRHVAGRLADNLTERLPNSEVFMDVDNIVPGADFIERIEQEVTTCHALLALIGPNWADVEDGRGRRRLDNGDDFVVLEIAAALASGVTVIPVLVDGAYMPAAEQLPASVNLLSRRHAVRLDHETFRSDFDALLNGLERALETSARRPATRDSSSMATATKSGAPGTAEQPPSATAHEPVTVAGSPPPADRPHWSVRAVSKGLNLALELVSVDGESYLLEVSNGNFNVVTIDGAEVARDAHFRRSTFDFRFGSPPNTHHCRLELAYVALVKVRLISITIDDQTPHPA